MHISPTRMLYELISHALHGAAKSKARRRPEHRPRAQAAPIVVRWHVLRTTPAGKGGRPPG